MARQQRSHHLRIGPSAVYRAANGIFNAFGSNPGNRRRVISNTSVIAGSTCPICAAPFQPSQAQRAVCRPWRDN
jgi:hypothetical protein